MAGSDHAIVSTDANRVSTFVKKFQQEAGGTQSHASAGTTRTRSSGGKATHTRTQIAQLYEQHRKGVYVGREAEWNRLEYDIIAAGREGRIANAVDIAGK
jgi:hypothetical protein